MSNQNELIPMQPGELLRYHREQLGLSIDQASALSRIKPAVLEAIERCETSHIPSVYLRGYIRNYARALELDPGLVESRMEHARGSEPAVQTVFTGVPPRGRTEKWLKVSSYVAASLVIAALAWQFTHEAVRLSQGEAQLSSGSATPAEQARPAADEPTRVLQPSNTHLNASIASMEVMQKRAENTAGEQAWAAIGARPESPADDSTAVPGQHRLRIATSADSWVEILDGNGQKIEMDLLRAGDSREYQGIEPFRIMVGRASAVELELDGEAVDLGPHTRGNVARLTLGEVVTADSGEPAQPENR